MDTSSCHAVLTGDIVGSRRLPKGTLDRLPETIALAARQARLEGAPEVFSGDSWQVFCADPHLAVERALVLRSYLLGEHGIETRVAIGMGSVDSLHPEKVSLSQGEAFVLSGQGLARMDEDRRLTVAAGAVLPSAVRALLEASCALLDALSSGWTEKQAAAIALASSELPQNELAKLCQPPISAQAFGKRLASARWKELKGALDAIAQGVRLGVAAAPEKEANGD